MRFDVVSNITYHALDWGLAQKRFVDLGSAIKRNPYLIIKEKNGIWYNLGYVNSVFEFAIYNGNGQEIFEIEENRWTLNRWTVLLNEYFQGINVYGQITDPNGQSTGFKHFGFQFGGVLSAIEKFRNMAAFESIENYNIHLENLKLKKKIEKIKSENAELQDQIDSLNE